MHVWLETAASGSEGAIRIKLDAESVVSDIAVQAAGLFRFGKGERDLKASQIAVWHEGVLMPNEQEVNVPSGETFVLKERKSKFASEPMKHQAAPNSSGWSSAAQFAPPRDGPAAATRVASPARAASNSTPVTPRINSIASKMTASAVKRQEEGKFARCKATKKLEGDPSSRPRWATASHPAPSPNPTPAPIPATPERKPAPTTTTAAAASIKADPVVMSRKKIKESTESSAPSASFERSSSTKPAVPKQAAAKKKEAPKKDKVPAAPAAPAKKKTVLPPPPPTEPEPQEVKAEEKKAEEEKVEEKVAVVEEEEVEKVTTPQMATSLPVDESPEPVQEMEGTGIETPQKSDAEEAVEQGDEDADASPPPPSVSPPRDEEEQREVEAPSTPPPVEEETPVEPPLDAPEEGMSSPEDAPVREEAEAEEVGTEEPAAPEAPRSPDFIEDDEHSEANWVLRFKEFYTLHNPSKTDGVDTIMERYESHQEKQELWEMLLKKYDRTEVNWRQRPEIQDEY